MVILEQWIRLINLLIDDFNQVIWSKSLPQGVYIGKNELWGRFVKIWKIFTNWLKIFKFFDRGHRESHKIFSKIPNP